MEFNFKRWLYYRFIRLAVKTKELKTDEKPLTKIQERTMKITMSMILDKDCELLINPSYDLNVGEKYYIKKVDDSGELEKFITSVSTPISAPENKEEPGSVVEKFIEYKTKQPDRAGVNRALDRRLKQAKFLYCLATEINDNEKRASRIEVEIGRAHV